MATNGDARSSRCGRQLAQSPLLECEMASLVLIFFAVLCPVFVQANTFCDSDFYYDWQYTTLYSKLEESLLSNKTLLDHVRHIFMSTESVKIYFDVQLQLDVNGSNLPSCESQQHYDCITVDSYTFCPTFDFDTFCISNSTNNVWELCNIPDQYGNTLDSLDMIYSSQTLSKMQWESQRHNVDNIIVYISVLHGSLLAAIFFWFGYGSEYGTGDYSHGFVSMNLRLERLDCNPPITLTKCVVSELLSWVCCIVVNEWKLYRHKPMPMALFGALG